MNPSSFVRYLHDTLRSVGIGSFAEVRDQIGLVIEEAKALDSGLPLYLHEQRLMRVAELVRKPYALLRFLQANWETFEISLDAVRYLEQQKPSHMATRSERPMQNPWSQPLAEVDYMSLFLHYRDMQRRSLSIRSDKA